MEDGYPPQCVSPNCKGIRMNATCNTNQKPFANPWHQDTKTSFANITPPAQPLELGFVLPLAPDVSKGKISTWMCQINCADFENSIYG